MLRIIFEVILLHEVASRNRTHTCPISEQNASVCNCLLRRLLLLFKNIYLIFLSFYKLCWKCFIKFAPQDILLYGNHSCLCLAHGRKPIIPVTFLKSNQQTFADCSKLDKSMIETILSENPSSKQWEHKRDYTRFKPLTFRIGVCCFIW